MSSSDSVASGRDHLSYGRSYPSGYQMAKVQDERLLRSRIFSFQIGDC
jgi:hypothetical protein